MRGEFLWALGVGSACGFGLARGWLTCAGVELLAAFWAVVVVVAVAVAVAVAVVLRWRWWWCGGVVSVAVVVVVMVR